MAVGFLMVNIGCLRGIMLNFDTISAALVIGSTSCTGTSAENCYFSIGCSV